MAVQKRKLVKKVTPKKDLVQPESLSSELTQNIEEDALPIVRDKIENIEDNTREESVDKTEAVNNDVSGEEGGKGSWAKKIVIWSGIAIVIGVLLGISWKLVYERGIAVGEAQMQERQEKEAVKQKEVVVAPTPEEVKKSTFTIEVLNGSGIGGEAARVKALLEKEGYTVSSVGNADKSDLEETTISAKSSVAKEWIDLLKTALGTSVVLSEPTNLDDTESADVIVTVGSKKAE